VIIFSEFSKRSVWYSPVSSDTVEEIAAILNKGDIPDITMIQKAAGA
jgi:(2Fe-2S) ferredoxin